MLYQSSIAQSVSKGFDGAIILASGASTLFDGKSGNNGIFLSKQIGLSVSKKLSKVSYCEFGILGTRKGIFVNEVNKGPGYSIQNIYNIFFTTIDVIVNYYHNFSKSTPNLYYLLGLSNSYIPNGFYAHQPGSHYNNISASIVYNPGISGGFSYHFGHISFNLNTVFYTRSLIKDQYKDEFSSSIDYFNSTLIPFELLITAKYKF